MPVICHLKTIYNAFNIAYMYNQVVYTNLKFLGLCAKLDLAIYFKQNIPFNNEKKR